MAKINIMEPTAAPRARPWAQTFAPYFPADASGQRPFSITINKPQDEVFLVLRNMDNFPHFFEKLERVESFAVGRFVWHFRDDTAPDGSFALPVRMEYGAQNDGLMWKAEDAAGFSYTVALKLEPAPAGRGTIVRMMVVYDNMVGELAGRFEKLLGKDAEVLSKKNLQRLKAFCETGHVPTTQGQPSGRTEDLETSLQH